MVNSLSDLNQQKLADYKNEQQKIFQKFPRLAPEAKSAARSVINSAFRRINQEEITKKRRFKTFTEKIPKFRKILTKNLTKNLPDELKLSDEEQATLQQNPHKFLHPSDPEATENRELRDSRRSIRQKLWKNRSEILRKLLDLAALDELTDETRQEIFNFLSLEAETQPQPQILSKKAPGPAKWDKREFGLPMRRRENSGRKRKKHD